MNPPPPDNYLLQPGEQSIFKEPHHSPGGFLIECGWYWGYRPQSPTVIYMHEVRTTKRADLCVNNISVVMHVKYQ